MRNVFSLKVQPNRIYGLDILRAFAIIFVVLVHSDTILPPWLFDKLYYFILDGVSIFFVLSGFLIGGILIKIFDRESPNKNTLLNFWIRRWFRTIPNYFFILTLLLVLKSIFNEEFNPLEYASFYIFSQNLFYPHPLFFQEAWSLSVEEWFYLLTPILVLFALRLTKLPVKKAFIVVIIIMIIVPTYFRYLKFSNLTISNFQDFDFLIRKQVITRLDSLMFGVFGAFLHYYYRELWFKRKYVLFGLGLFIFLLLKLGVFSLGGYSMFYSTFSLTLVSMATLLLLPYLCSVKVGKGFLFKTFTFISLISYSMYLVHLSIVQGWIFRSIDFSKLGLSWIGFLCLKYFLYWFLTLLLSFGLYKYFEVPMMNLRDRVNLKK